MGDGQQVKLAKIDPRLRLRSAVGCRREGDRCHGEDAFGESPMAPGLKDAPRRDEIDVDPMTSSSVVENGPPIFVLMVAFLPVTSACLRESASNS